MEIPTQTANEIFMINRINALIKRKNSCVLATMDGHAPHCSLMAYTVSKDGDRLYLVTQRDTKKYRNIRRHPGVSLLIDTRDEQSRSQTEALTVSGTCHILKDIEEISKVKEAFKRHHPQLGTLIGKGGIAFLSVAFESFLFLEGPEKAYRENLK
jgi:nitroimidazol reductase NimA-like FMN-containing flavoprotein (pyridoxamine 5'-phosphate oxidase superfamily)